MSSTNKTTYYELPQFVDNDIFNPLVDDNDAYSKIDTALHNIADAEADDASEIVSVKSRLDSAESDIDALEAQNGNSVLTTTAQTLSGAVNELDADASALDCRLDIVEDDINNASTGLKVKVSALETQNGSEVLTTTAQTLSGGVNEVNGKADANSEDIANINTRTDDVLYHFPALHVAQSGGTYLSDGGGNCCIIDNRGKYYMVDCFTQYQMENYGLPYLNDIGVTEIEKLFITHYHSDHCRGIVALISGGITIKSAVLAPEPDWSQTAFWTANGGTVQESYNIVITALTNANIPYTFAGTSEIELDDGMTVKALNTDYTPYYSMTTPYPAGKNQNDSDEGIYADYNNLCVLYCFEKNGTRAMFLSDANYSCIQNNKASFKRSALITIPHHDHDTFVVEDAMKKLNPDVAITQDTANEFGTILGLLYRKCARYLNAIGVKTYITFGDDVVAKVNKDGAFIYEAVNHAGYYDQLQIMQDLYKWMLVEHPFYNTLAEKVDCNTLPAGTQRVTASSDNIPEAGTGYLIMTYIGRDSYVKLQVAVSNSTRPKLFIRTAGDSSAYRPWEEWIPNLYGYGKPINNNQDLDNFTTFGVYTCQNGTIASTLSNSPITDRGFRLEVRAVGSGLEQRVIGNDGDVLWHRNYANMSSWRAWKSVTFT